MLAERMADSLLNDGIIADDEKEVVRFGLENLGGNLLGFVMTLTIGLCFKRMGNALILWLLLFPIRKNAGGYHASTKIRCLLLSAIMMILAFAIYALPNAVNIRYIYSVLITGSIIWFLVPIDNPKKKLDDIEYNVYRIRSRKILVLESAIFVFAFCFKWENIVISICMTFFLVSLSLLMGLLKKQALKLHPPKRAKNIVSYRKERKDNEIKTYFGYCIEHGSNGGGNGDSFDGGGKK